MRKSQKYHFSKKHPGSFELLSVDDDPINQVGGERERDKMVLLEPRLSKINILLWKVGYRGHSGTFGIYYHYSHERERGIGVDEIKRVLARCDSAGRTNARQDRL